MWRPVYLKGWSQVKVDDLFIKQRVVTAQNASLEVQITVNNTTEGLKTGELYVDSSKRPLFSKKVWLSEGESTIKLPFDLKNIELWWPNGLGKQKQYHFKVVIINDDKSLVCKEVKRGLRNIEILQEAGEKGESFYVKVNGKAVFMKGSNYIPQDNFLPEVSKERYQHVINTAVESNMNMLRVWGGGIYENDLFYDLCDEKGILVWQDFMFACALYPPLPDLKKSIYNEAVYNIKRLRNHASVAMYCGNNEIAMFMRKFWRDFKPRTPADSVALAQTYENIFHEILPAVIKAHDDDKFYWSSYPNGVNYSSKMVSDKTRGDAHYWGVWHGKKPFETFKDNISPFMSEYGFQSFPELETVKTYAIQQIMI